MPGLRFAYLLGLIVWLGGLLVLAGVMAPLVFDALEARTPVEGRALAGAIVGSVFSRFHLVSAGCGGLMLVALVAMALLGPRPRPFGPRLAIIGLMLAITAVIAVPVGSRLHALQAAIDGPVASLPGNNPRRTSFERLHELSRALLTINVLGGFVLVFWDARERRA